MPQITTNEPSLQELISLYGNVGLPAQVANRRLQEGQASTKINQDQALQDLFANQQKLPGELRNQELTGDTMQAHLPGIRAQGTISGIKANADAIVGPEAFAKSIKTGHEEATNKAMWEKRSDMAYQKLMSDNPEDQKLGKRMLDNMPANYAEQVKHKHATDVANIYASSRKEINQAQITAGKYDQVKQRLMLAGVSAQFSHPIAFAVEKVSTTTGEERVQWQQRLDFLVENAKEQARARGDGNQANAIDMAAYGGKVLAPTPRPATPLPEAMKPSAAPTPKASVETTIKGSGAKPQMSARDKAAYDWATANPKDPRSSAILEKIKNGL